MATKGLGEGAQSNLLGDCGRDGLAGTAPGREPVDHDDLVLGEGLLELGGAVREMC